MKNKLVGGFKKIGALVFLMSVIWFSGCSNNSGDVAGSSSIQVTKIEKTFCAMAGCETSEINTGESFTVDYSSQISITGSVSDSLVSNVSYSVDFDCGSLTGELPVTSGTFEFNYPVSGNYIPTECESELTKSTLDGKIIFSIESLPNAQQTITFSFNGVTAD